MNQVNTNIKNLPPGEYVTELGYSQSCAWKVIKKTAKTMTIQAVRTKRDPEWKPEMHAGGFCAHCSNQHSQTWLYDGLLGVQPTRVIRKTKKGWSLRGVRYVENCARRFYDYNF